MSLDAMSASGDFAGFLVERGLLDAAALERARRAQAGTSDPLDRVVQHLGLVAEDKLYAAIADFMHLPMTTVNDVPPQPVLPQKLNPVFLFANRIIPLEDRPDRLIIASADPFNPSALKAISFATGKPIAAQILTPSSFDKIFANLYPETSTSPDLDADPLQFDASFDDDLQRLRDMASEAPIVRLVNQLFEAAVERRASDIHIEPVEGNVHFRLRVDGLLQHYQSVPRALQAALSSRVKILAKLNIAEHRLPQDGRIRVSVRGRDIDLRVSCMPTQYGESIVLRLLDKHAVELSYASLGFSPDMAERIRALLGRPNGIILVTGPTGSGKTTTLYTGLVELSDISRKIFSVEDPVEYELAGISQVQVRPGIGLTFANALRSILRQDPDIIMVGEIRDLETAQIAMQASLTGHLVLSTLHTNNAASTINRLLDMGVEHYLVSSTVAAIIAQRLVRRLCPHCANPHVVAPETAIALGVPAHLTAGGAITLHKPSGCVNCQQTGFIGRIVVAELLVMNDEIRRMIANGASEVDLQAAAQRQGMVPMYDTGMNIALAGKTTIEDVLRASHAG